MAQKKTKKPEPDAAPRVAVGRALAEDLAAGLEAVKAGTKDAATELPPSAVAALAGIMGTPASERLRSGAAAFGKQRRAELEAELAALRQEAETLAFTPDEGSPQPASEGQPRVLYGSIRDGHDRSPLPALAVVLRGKGYEEVAPPATVTDEIGRFQLPVLTDDPEARVEVLDPYGRSITSVKIPPEDEAGGELHIEVDGAKLPPNRALAEITGRLRSDALARARSRIESAEAELRLLGGE